MAERRGSCPECGRDCAVTAAGKIRQHLHGDPDRAYRSVCSGTGQAPKALAEDPVAAAESRGRAAGYAEAAQALRDGGEAYRAFFHVWARTAPQAGTWGSSAYAAADYLESIASRATTEETPR